MHNFAESIEVNFAPVVSVQFVPQLVNFHLGHVLPLWSDHFLQVLFADESLVLLVIFLEHFLQLRPRLKLSWIWRYDSHEGCEVESSDTFLVIFCNNVISCLFCRIKLFLQQRHLQVVWCQLTCTIGVVEVECFFYQNYISLRNTACYIKSRIELLVLLLHWMLHSKTRLLSLFVIFLTLKVHLEGVYFIFLY